MGSCVAGSRQQARPGWGPRCNISWTEGWKNAGVMGTRGKSGTPRVSSNVCDVLV